jgi:hypothetical protein
MPRSSSKYRRNKKLVYTVNPRYNGQIGGFGQGIRFASVRYNWLKGYSQKCRVGYIATIHSKHRNRMYLHKGFASLMPSTCNFSLCSLFFSLVLLTPHVLVSLPISRCTICVLQGIAIQLSCSNCLGIFFMLGMRCSHARVLFMAVLVCWIFFGSVCDILQVFAFVGAAAPCLAVGHHNCSQPYLVRYNDGLLYVDHLVAKERCQLLFYSWSPFFLHRWRIRFFGFKITSETHCRLYIW